MGQPGHAHVHEQTEGRHAGAPGQAHTHGHKHGHEPHDHAHSSMLRGTPLRRLTWAFAITAGFMVVEAAMGVWARSLALLADAGHMLADSAALLLAILAQRIASHSRTRSQTYGYRRAEVLAAFANGIALALTAIWIFSEAVERWNKPPDVNAYAMTATAVVGLLVNLGSAAMLATGTGHNPNTRAALAHVLSDAIGSVGAIVAGVVILASGWTRVDPVISVIIGVLVLWGSWRLVRETTRVLMEGSPLEIDIAHVEDTIRSVPGVVDFHDLHVWSISEGFDVLTVHVVIDRGHHGTEVVSAVSRSLRERHRLEHVTIQPETQHDDRLLTIGLRGPDSAAKVADDPSSPSTTVEGAGGGISPHEVRGARGEK